MIRPLQPEDVPAVIALNNAHAVEISLTDPEKFARMLSVAALSTAVGPVGDPDAFLVAFDERTPVQGPNHRWFIERHPRFFYVDRVAVHARARRRGLARALYLDAFARTDAPIICCEVNFDPPNPGSDAFHEALGFAEVGRAFLADRGKTVRYLERKP